MDITISKSGIVWCVFMIIGCVLLGNSFIGQTRYYDAVNFSELNSTNWKYGDYVSGNITSLVKRKINNKSYNTCSGNLGSYFEYTVPVADNQFVRLYVTDKKTRTLLEEAANQEEFSIPFTGVLSSSNYSINYDFYDAAGGIEKEQIIKEFVITQTSKTKMNTNLILGLIILVTCLAIKLVGILPPIVTVEEPLEVPVQKRYGSSCDYESEIEAQKHTIAKLEEQMEKLYKDYHISLLLLPVGVIPILIFIVFSQLLHNLYAVVLWIIYYLLGSLGLVIVVTAIYGICRYYIQTTGKLGLFLRTFKNITPIPRKIEICKENIKYLEEKLAYQNSLTLIYSDIPYSDLIAPPKSQTDLSVPKP